MNCTKYALTLKSTSVYIDEKAVNNCVPDVALRLFECCYFCVMLQIHKKVAGIFVTTHQSVAEVSEKMKLELKRHNYVTPTNYLELVSGYKR